jgi:hypothetical protein
MVGVVSTNMFPWMFLSNSVLMNIICEFVVHFIRFVSSVYHICIHYDHHFYSYIILQGWGGLWIDDGLSFWTET